MARDIPTPDYGNTEHTAQASGPSIWQRAIYMVLFVIVFHIVASIIGVVMVVQFVLMATSGNTNDNLANFGRQLSQYLSEIVQFQTFNSEEKPFPFKSWPENN